MTVEEIVRREIGAWWELHWPLAGWPTRHLVRGVSDPVGRVEELIGRLEASETLAELSARIAREVEGR